MGCGNVFIGKNSGHCANAGVPLYCACNSIYIGYGTRSGLGSNNYPRCEIVIGWEAVGNGHATGTYGNSSIQMSCMLCGTVSKGSGSFRIIHPNPNKKNKWLYHSFAESPNAGDNVYRWSVNVSGGCCVMKLPDYYNDLNENSMAWVKPVDHFGSAYAEVDENQKNLHICSDKDGCYNILLIGTRCDIRAKDSWKGTEREN
jgi:hypothetical protein